jgi:outer membrane protein assembly factor BamB
MLSRWLRLLVVAPVVLLAFGGMLSCGGSSGGSPTPAATPGFGLIALSLQDGPPATATFTITPVKTPKATPSPTLTPTTPATTTCVPTGLPTPVQFNALGTFSKKSKVKFMDLTTASATMWSSSNSNVLMAPLPGPNGGNFTTGVAGCACILASNSGLSSQFVGVGVGVDDCADNCPSCPAPVPTPTATADAAPGAMSTASNTAAQSSRSAGVLMWTFDAGAELRGKIAAGADGSIFFITRDGVLHGLDSSGKEVMRRDAAGSSPAVLPDGTVIAMSSKSAIAAFSANGTTLWNLEIGNSAGPLATADGAIYASAGGDLVSVSASGSLNWRVSIGAVNSAAPTDDGVVVGTSGGAVTALASDGAVLWTFEPEGGFSGSVAYAGDVVYAGSAGGGVYAIDSSNGNPLWHVNSAHAVTAGPAVAPSGTIFAGADAIYGVSADGHLRWTDPTLKPGDAGVLVLGYDSVFEAAAGDVGAVLAGDGSYVWTSRSFGKITTAASSPSGMLYVGTSTGRIFAVR